MKKFKDSKVSRKLVYEMVTNILPILQRFSRSTGISDVNELCDHIYGLSVDEFCDYKFNDDPILISSEDLDHD